MDIENVIKGLECCEIGSGDRCYETECPYYGQGCTESLKNDILEFLKEQEPKPVELHTNAYGTKFYFCPKCKRELFHTRNLNFCERCGQEVRWNDG